MERKEIAIILEGFKYVLWSITEDFENQHGSYDSELGEILVFCRTMLMKVHKKLKQNTSDLASCDSAISKT